MKKLIFFVLGCLLFSGIQSQRYIRKDTSWHSADVRGGHNVTASGVFDIIPGYRIISIDFACAEIPPGGRPGCAWNYSAGGGRDGYAKTVAIQRCSDKVPATWARVYGGAPVIQKYSLLYKKIEITPFWDGQLVFKTDGAINEKSEVFLVNKTATPVTLRYKTEYQLAGDPTPVINECFTASLKGYETQRVGLKYHIDPKAGLLPIKYSVVEAPFNNLQDDPALKIKKKGSKSKVARK